LFLILFGGMFLGKISAKQGYFIYGSLDFPIRYKGTSIYYKKFHEGALVCIQRGEKPSKIGFLEVPITLIYQKKENRSPMFIENSKSSSC